MEGFEGVYCCCRQPRIYLALPLDKSCDFAIVLLFLKRRILLLKISFSSVLVGLHLPISSQKPLLEGGNEVCRQL